MKVRSIVLAGAVAAGLLTQAAQAAPKVCNLLVDDKGDATAGLLSIANEPAWDILSADIATDAKMLTAVIRVDKLTKATTAAPYGSQWRVDFVVAGGANPLFMQARTSPFGDTFSFGYVSTTSSTFVGTAATGVFDEVKNEVRISAPLAEAAEQAKMTAGTKITDLSAGAGDFVNVAGRNPSLSNEADSADGGKSYTAGAASCVKVGK